MMRVAEKFISINGEGTRAGALAVFIRFQGCNLRCSYCDTKWAYAPDCPVEELTAQEITDYVLSTGIHNVPLTGGEPLLQEDMSELLRLLLGYARLRVEIETNGAVGLAPFCLKPRRPVFTMDYKLPTSGSEEAMLLDNFDYLTADDTVKFVIGSFLDMERARDIIESFELTRRCHVYLSPVFGSIEPADMVSYMKQHNMNDVRLQIQIHKVIWDPAKRGV